LSQLKQQLAAGIIGDIQTIHSTIGFAFQDRPQSRLFNLALGGGALLDLGVYSITISQFLLDEHPLKIQAMGKIGPSGVDEHCLVNMQYASGRMSQFICTAHSQADNIMTIVGSRGRIVLPSCFWDVDQALVYQNNNLVMNMDIPHKINGFEYQIEASMDCIEAGRPYSELMSHADSIGVMRVMDEVRQQLGLVFDGDIEAL
jgi:predicted dehydrogenase